MNTKDIIEGSPAIKSTTIAYSDRFIMTIGGVVNIYDNLISSDCDMIIDTQKIKQIQFAKKFIVSNETYGLINGRLLNDSCKPTLRLTLNGFGAEENLDCLEFLNNTKSLSVDMFKNKEIENINKYLQLEHLAIGGQGLSIKSISEQIGLSSLFVFDKLKDIETIGKLVNLKKLTISRMTLKSLDFLTSLKKLKELNFMLGSATDYEKLFEIGELKKLSFTRVRQLKKEHLLVLNKMKYLNELTFDTQPNLFDLDWLTDKSINAEVINCKNLKK